MSEAAAPATSSPEAAPAPAAAPQTAPSAAAAPAAPAPTASQLLGDAPAEAPKSPAWTEGLPDDLRGYAENKRWSDPAAALKSYQELEKVIGAPPERVLKLPGDDSPEAWDGVYKRLGRPDSADGYEFEGGPVEGIIDMTPQIREWAHEAGLSQKQAAKIHAKYNEQVTAMLGQIDEQTAQVQAADLATLRKEWGSTYGENIDAGKRAKAAFDLDDSAVAKLEEALGTAPTLKLMAKIGRALGEHRVSSEDRGTNAQPFGRTPAASMDRIKTLMTDKAFTERLKNKEPAAMREWTQLHEEAYAE